MVEVKAFARHSVVVSDAQIREFLGTGLRTPIDEDVSTNRRNCLSRQETQIWAREHDEHCKESQVRAS